MKKSFPVLFGLGFLFVINGSADERTLGSLGSEDLITVSLPAWDQTTPYNGTDYSAINAMAVGEDNYTLYFRESGWKGYTGVDQDCEFTILAYQSFENGNRTDPSDSYVIESVFRYTSNIADTEKAKKLLNLKTIDQNSYFYPYVSITATVNHPNQKYPVLHFHCYADIKVSDFERKFPALHFKTAWEEFPVRIIQP